MPKAKVTVEDLNQMLRNSLVMYKNKPVRVDTVYETNKFGLFDLTTQRNVILEKVDYDEFKAPGRVLGFVNVGGFAIYVSRNPIRRYKVGICNENANFDCPAEYEDAGRFPRVYDMTAPELVDTIFGRYPSISEAFERVKGGAESIVAFDRQFAVDRRGNVYYKTIKVGTVKAPKTVYDIKFSEKFAYLITCLDNNHEKSLRAA